MSETPQEPPRPKIVSLHTRREFTPDPAITGEKAIDELSIKLLEKTLELVKSGQIRMTYVVGIGENDAPIYIDLQREMYLAKDIAVVNMATDLLKDRFVDLMTMNDDAVYFDEEGDETE